MVDKYPKCSSFVCYGRSVWGRGFSQQIIARWFYKLVDRKDHIGVPKSDLIEHFYKLSHTERTREF